MRLPEFQDRLERLIGRPTDLRPFVCDGSPLDCRVFLVGFNPATGSSGDFWRFWSKDGFDKPGWLKEYERNRSERPLGSGKSFRPRITPSRRVLQWIGEAAGIPLLETNLYAKASDDMRSLTERDLEPFLFLVDAIRPSLIVTHGREAHEVVGGMSLTCPTIGVAHFSRGWSRDAAKELGRSLRRHVVEAG